MRPTLLVVDDEADVAERLRTLLRRDDPVFGATRIEEALNLLQEEDLQVPLAELVTGAAGAKTFGPQR